MTTVSCRGQCRRRPLLCLSPGPPPALVSQFSYTSITGPMGGPTLPCPSMFLPPPLLQCCPRDIPTYSVHGHFFQEVFMGFPRTLKPLLLSGHCLMMGTGVEKLPSLGCELPAVRESPHIFILSAQHQVPFGWHSGKVCGLSVGRPPTQTHWVLGRDKSESESPGRNLSTALLGL